MESSLMKCPVCGKRLHVSKITCEQCGIEISGKFEIPLFDDKDYEFIRNFIACEGNISRMQTIYDDTYKGIKDRLFDIKEKMGVEEMCKKQKNIDFTKNQTNNKVVKRLQEKIEEGNGKGYISSLKGDDIPFWLADDQTGFYVKQLKNVIFTFEMLDDVVRKANKLGGKMYRGDTAAQSGAKLGSEKLSLDTIDGYIASKYFGTKENESVLRRSTYIAGILDWAGIATNHRSDGVGGYIVISPLFRE